MQILVLNQTWFVEELRALGHRVVTVGLQPRFDVCLPHPLFTFREVLARCPAGFSPDRILVLDNSGPVVVADLENIDIPALFYSIDVHHHLGFHKYFFQAFDRTLVAQKDYLDSIAELGLSGDRPAAKWLPLWASETVEPRAVKDLGAVFVGSLNLSLNPQRVKFFEELKKAAPILVTSGNFLEIFPRSAMVVNQTVNGDINFRIFEAMVAGPLLLTERTGNGLLDLFEEGTHLLLYSRGSVEEAAEKIRWMLENPAKAEAIAQAGRALVLERHLPRQRAIQIEEELRRTTKINSAWRAVAGLMNNFWMAQRLEGLDRALATRAHQTVLAGAKLAMEWGEVINQEVATSVLISAAIVERRTGDGIGNRTTELLIEGHPGSEMLALVKISRLMQQGDRLAAEQMAAQRFSQLPISTVLRSSADLERQLSEQVFRLGR